MVYWGIAGSHSLGERKESPGVCVLSFRQNHHFDILDRESLLEHCSTAAEKKDPIEIRVHPHMGLQFPLDIPDDVLHVSNTGLPDLPRNVVSLEAVLEVAFFDKEGDFDRGKGT